MSGQAREITQNVCDTNGEEKYDNGVGKRYEGMDVLVPGSNVCVSPPAAVDAPAPDVIEAFDPNPKALNAPENVDRPSRFAVRPPVASTPPAAVVVPVVVDEVVGVLLALRPWE